MFIDLSGKARGIFDRSEMMLPDEPAEEPGSAIDDDDDDDAGDAGDAEHADAVAEQDAPAQEPEAVAVDAPAAEATTGESKPEEPSSHGAERRVAGRRIIVAAGALAVEPAPAPATEPGSPAPEAETAADASTDTNGVAVDGNAQPEVAAIAEPVPPPRPAPYAPPIVLELGAHFVGLVHNDGSRGGLIVLTRHPRRLALMEESKSMPFAAVWDFYCLQHGAPVGEQWLAEVKKYEQDVLSKRA